MNTTRNRWQAADGMRFLREYTRCERGCVQTVLIRAAVASPAAAEVLVKAELRTRADRHAAVMASALAIAAEMDEAAA